MTPKQDDAGEPAMARATITCKHDDQTVHQWTSDTIQDRRGLTERRRGKPGFATVPGGIAWDEHYDVDGVQWVERVTVVWE